MVERGIKANAGLVECMLSGSRVIILDIVVSHVVRRERAAAIMASIVLVSLLGR